MRKTALIPVDAAPSGTAAQRRRAHALVLCAIGAVILGLSPLFVRSADVGPQASAFWRAALALPLALLWATMEARRSPRRAAPSGRDPRAHRALALAALGGLFFAGDLTFWHLAILNTSLANATFITNGLPVALVALGAWLVFRERPSRLFWLATLLAVLGAALLLGESARFDPARLSGDVFSAITAVFLSAYLLAMRAAGAEARPGAAMLAAATATTLGLAAGFMASGETQFLPQTAIGWASVLALGIVCQGLGQGAIMTSVRVLPAEVAALVLLLEPVTTALFGWLWAGEALSGQEFLGGALALAAIALGARSERRPTQTGTESGARRHQ